MTRRNVLSGGGKTPAPPAAAVADAPDGSPSSGASGGGSGASSGRHDAEGGISTAGANDGPITAPFDAATDLACAKLAQSDLGLAERWLLRSGDNFRFCAEIGWFAWDGRRWELLSEEKDKAPARVMQSIFLAVRAIANEARLIAATGCRLGDSGLPERKTERLPHGFLDHPANAAWFDALPCLDREIPGSTRPVLLSTKLSGFALKCEAKGRMEAAASIVKSFPGIAVHPDSFDRDRMAINVLNGTLRLERIREKRSSAEIEAGKSEWRTGGWKVKLSPHDRADLMTKVAEVKFAPAAKCAEYDAFMARVQPDETMRRFVHMWGGLSLTGYIGEQKLAFFYGSGRNGKGTWVETIAHIAGDYAGSIPIESFLDSGGQRRGDQATPDIARLPGVRFLRVSEPKQGSTLNEGLVKQVTGEDPVDARHLNKGFFTFLPSFKMTISGNNRPKVKDTSDGIWRRMQLVPWAVQIPKDEVDRDLGRRMREGEASGILNRLIEGLVDWKENGLIEPEAVRNATQAYRDDSDELGQFLSQCCVVGGDPKVVRVRVSDMTALYEAWSQAGGGSGWKPRGFNNAMRDKQFERKHSNGEWWVGVMPMPGATPEAIREGRWPPELDAGGLTVPGEFDMDEDPFGA